MKIESIFCCNRDYTYIPITLKDPTRDYKSYFEVADFVRQAMLHHNPRPAMATVFVDSNRILQVTYRTYSIYACFPFPDYDLIRERDIVPY